MDSDRLLSIGAGIAQGLEKATQNIQNIQIAKYNLQRQQKSDDLDFKVKKLQLQKAEMEFDPEQIKGQKELLDAETKFKKQAFNLANLQIEKALAENKDKVNNLSVGGQYLSKIAEDYNLDIPGYKPRTETQKYRDDLNFAKAGQMTWDESKNKYPESSKQEDIEKTRRSTLPKLERSPSFRMGRGLPALMSKEVANLNEKTVKVIEQIENQEDLDELLKRREEAEIKGIDVKGILEYFGKAE